MFEGGSAPVGLWATRVSPVVEHRPKMQETNTVIPTHFNRV